VGIFGLLGLVYDGLCCCCQDGIGMKERALALAKLDDTKLRCTKG
jgi:hypothetical protein